MGVGEDSEHGGVQGDECFKTGKTLSSLFPVLQRKNLIQDCAMDVETKDLIFCPTDGKVSVFFLL